jgi:hypothetical protein
MPAPAPVYIPSAFSQLISDTAKKTIETLHEFIYDEVMPTEKLFEAQMPADRWSSFPPIIEELKKKAKKLGLWNLFLHRGYNEGPGFTNLEYAIMAELTGLTRLGPEVRRPECRLYTEGRRLIALRLIRGIWKCLPSTELPNRRKSGLFRC